ncbi:hypothetical protein Tco_1111014 [Tanacetum coccineum]|uniref:Uncharacterized protein n=1 Tax=Tanacetum coccineum TaxID=301880 RepID=A0ABQ5IKW8_9ASTR
MFQANHEDAYAQLDEGPMRSRFLPTCHPLVQPTIQSMRYTPMFNQIFDNVDYQLSQEMHQEEHLDSDAETEIDDNTIPYHQYLLDTEAQNVPTEVSADTSNKKPKKETNDLHKDILGTRNPGLGYMAKRAQPVLYDADTLLHPNHHPVSIWDSDDVLVHQVVSMKKMNEKPGHVRPKNGFYEKLNALIRPPSQVLASLRNVNAVFPQFEGLVDDRPQCCCRFLWPTCHHQCPPTVKSMRQELSGDQVVLAVCTQENFASQASNPSSLLTPFVHKSRPPKKDICSIVLTSDIVVPPSSNCLCEDLRSACDREHTKVLELEAEVLKQQKMVIESEKLANKKSGGFYASCGNPKVLASGMYTKSSKYIPPPKRANWVKPTPLPKKKQGNQNRATASRKLCKVPHLEPSYLALKSVMEESSRSQFGKLKLFFLISLWIVL